MSVLIVKLHPLKEDTHAGVALIGKVISSRSQLSPFLICENVPMGTSIPEMMCKCNDRSMDK